MLSGHREDFMVGEAQSLVVFRDVFWLPIHASSIC